MTREVWLQGEVYIVRLTDQRTGISVEGSGRDRGHVEQILRRQLDELCAPPPQQ